VVTLDGRRVALTGVQRQLWDAWVAGYAGRHQGLRPDCTPAVVRQLRALAASGHPLPEILEQIRVFFAVGTGWVRRRGAWTIPAFRAAWDELVTARVRREV
jgi:hypothetical protein